MKDIRKTKKIYIEWVDSFAIPGWKSPDTLNLNEDKICSIGYLVKDSKESITITTSISTYGNVMDALTIPKCSITKRAWKK